MNDEISSTTYRGLTDAGDRLLSADGKLAELQEDCRGSIPGALAIPELLELVQQARHFGLKITREFSAFDGDQTICAYATITPRTRTLGGGCEILVENWQEKDHAFGGARETGVLMDEIDRAAAEIVAQLDEKQYLRHLTADALDASELRAAVKTDPGKAWSEYVDIRDVAHHQPLHWRLLDAARCTIPGSERDWRLRLIPIGPQGAEPRGFELLLIADQPLDMPVNPACDADAIAQADWIGSALTQALRQPIARIISNAETMSSRLAGPLRAEYSEYAEHIASAGQHLSAMLDDLVDLEVVEAEDFAPVSEDVDLSGAAKRAAGILSGQAKSRQIQFDLRGVDGSVNVKGEFRRVLQILINLMGNAIAYSPENSTVTLRYSAAKQRFAALEVKDEGPGIEPGQAEKVFEKFERLGRDRSESGEAGSGLGLYISRRLAVAMGGSLECLTDRIADDGDQVSGKGAIFRLTLPIS